MPAEWNTKKRPGEFFEINDIIHGQITVFQPIGKIIDTKAFQRLRNLTQLNASQFVYPSANHNRFSHSLGVYHLARKMVEHLAKKYPELGITSTDELCVSIAGLIHDLGHGPFSHLYEHFLKHMGVEGFKHEEMSCKIFDHLLQTEGELRLLLEKYLAPEDILFIKELINPPERLLNDQGEWQPKGRGREKAFLYEIVNNPHTGLDVDKIDYILRDAKITNVGNRLRINDWRRILNNALVTEHPVEQRNCIAYSHKTISLIRKIFEDRIELHETVYQHKASLAVDQVLMQILAKANQHLVFSGSAAGDKGIENGASPIQFRMVEAFRDVEAFLKMDNGIVGIIKYLADHGDKDVRTDLCQARELLQKIEKRELPKLVKKLELNPGVDKGELIERLKRAMVDGNANNGEWAAAQTNVELVRLDQGQGVERSPLQKIVLLTANKHGKRRTHFFESAAESGGHLFAYIYVPFGQRAALAEPIKRAVKVLKADGHMLKLKARNGARNVPAK